MEVNFMCSVCGRRLALDQKWEGHSVQCPYCGNVFKMKVSQHYQSEKSFDVEKSVSVDDGMKCCPMCGEKILKAAKKCRYCGEYMDGQQKHVAVNGPNGGRLFSQSTYSGEAPVQVPRNNYETLCFWLGVLFGISLIGILIAFLIGGKDGLVASLKGALVGLLIYLMVIVMLGGCAALI